MKRQQKLAWIENTGYQITLCADEEAGECKVLPLPFCNPPPYALNNYDILKYFPFNQFQNVNKRVSIR